MSFGSPPPPAVHCMLLTAGNGDTVIISSMLATEKTRPSQSRTTGPRVSLTRVQPRLPEDGQ